MNNKRQQPKKNWETWNERKKEERINFLCVFVYFVGGGGDADGSYLAGRAVAGSWMYT